MFSVDSKHNIWVFLAAKDSHAELDAHVRALFSLSAPPQANTYSIFFGHSEPNEIPPLLIKGAVVFKRDVTEREAQALLETSVVHMHNDNGAYKEMIAKQFKSTVEIQSEEPDVPIVISLNPEVGVPLPTPIKREN